MRGHERTRTTLDPSALPEADRIRELLVGTLFAVFNERDPERRSKAITANYTDDVLWTDPDGTTQGRQALSERAQELLDRSPDFVYSAAGPVYVSGDLGLLAFNLGVPERRRRSAASTWHCAGCTDRPLVYDLDRRELTSEVFKK